MENNLKELQAENKRLLNLILNLVKNKKRNKFGKLLLLLIDNEIEQEKFCNG